MAENDSEDFVNIRITESEQEALRQAMESTFSDASRCTFGGFVQLMAREWEAAES